MKSLISNKNIKKLFKYKIIYNFLVLNIKIKINFLKFKLNN